MPACQPSQSGSAVPVADSCAQQLGAILRSSRLEQGLSLRTLAKRVGLSAHSGVAEYERGTRIPPADLIDAYERALALPSGYLMNMRQQIMRERARSTNSDSPVLSSTPDELAIAAPDHRFALGVIAAIVVTATTVVIAASARRITLSSRLRSGRVLVHVCVHSDVCSSA